MVLLLSDDACGSILLLAKIVAYVSVAPRYLSVRLTGGVQPRPLMPAPAVDGCNAM